MAALQQATRTVPIVFVNVTDPVGAGFVASLARPGRNVTGFLLFEYGIGVKWLELLKEIAPAVTRVGVIRDASNASGIGQFGAIQAVAPSFGVELYPIDVQDAGEIKRAVADFARGPNSGLIVTSSTLALVHRELIIELAARHRLPSVYNVREFSARGGLISTDPICKIGCGKQLATSTASLRERSRPIFLCRRRLSTNWLSTLKPPRHSASACRLR